MKISKKSWHYKYLTKTGDTFYKVPYDLCTYIQHLVKRILFHIAVSFVVFGTAYTVGSGFKYLPNSILQYPVAVLIGFVILSIICGLTFLIVVACFAIKEKISKSDGLVTNYIRTKNEKVCKSIDYED